MIFQATFECILQVLKLGVQEVLNKREKTS